MLPSGWLKTHHAPLNGVQQFKNNLPVLHRNVQSLHAAQAKLAELCLFTAQAFGITGAHRARLYQMHVQRRDPTASGVRCLQSMKQVI